MGNILDANWRQRCENVTLNARKAYLEKAVGDWLRARFLKIVLFLQQETFFEKYGRACGKLMFEKWWLYCSRKRIFNEAAPFRASANPAGPGRWGG